LASWIALRMMSRARPGWPPRFPSRPMSQSVRAGALGAAARVRLQAIDGGGGSREAACRDVQFDGRYSHPHVIGVDRHPEERLELRRRSNCAEPARRPRQNLFVGASIPVDRPLEQELCLLLRGHRLHGVEMMLGEHRSRCPVAAALRVQRRADRERSGRKRRDQGGPHGAASAQGGCHRNAPTTQRSSAPAGESGVRT
jgi:hypothetical protein